MRKTIGTILLVLYALGWLGVVDFRLCIGKPGACSAAPNVKPLATV
jgi:hypothetical protein